MAQSIKLGYERISGKSTVGGLSLLFIVVDLSAKKIRVSFLTNSFGVVSCLCHLLEVIRSGLLDYEVDILEFNATGVRELENSSCVNLSVLPCVVTEGV